MALKVCITLMTVVLLHWWSANGDIIATSIINECIRGQGGDELRNAYGDPCTKKLVVAMTADTEESKSQYIEANISRTTETGADQSKRIRKPYRIYIEKSPVIINYRVLQVGKASYRPYEEVVRKKGSWCRDDWYAKDWELECHVEKIAGVRVFDSQGRCCRCENSAKSWHRGAGPNQNRCPSSETAHCLRFDPFYVKVFELFPPQLLFNIKISLLQKEYDKQDGTEVWVDKATFYIGPNKRKIVAPSFQFKAEYIGDLRPNQRAMGLTYKMLLAPDLDSYTGNLKNLPSMARNRSEWLLVDKHLVELSGLFCDRIGVGHRAFRNQPSLCDGRTNDCLRGQPHQLWAEDDRARREGKPGFYMAHNYGRILDHPRNDNLIDYRLDFLYEGIRRSIFTITMEADSLKTIINRSPGRIVEAYISPFEALSVEGLLTILVQNTGSVSASYQVSVDHCSAGVEWVPAKTINIEANEVRSISFAMHSFHSIGQINRCEIYLYDELAELLDNMTLHFQTLDTCFCYGYCGCSCGDNKTNCPEAPDIFHNKTQKKDPFSKINPFKGLSNLELLKFGSLFGSIALSLLILYVLIALGVLKIVFMLYTGQARMPFEKQIKQFLLGVMRCVFICCRKCWIETRKATAEAGTAVGAFSGEAAQAFATEDLVDDTERELGLAPVKRPRVCDGMCRGARVARKAHRRKVRILRRKGMAVTEVWWEAGYECTCRVRQYKVKKRKQRYRAKRAAKRKKKDNLFLSLDAYSRGATDMLEFDPDDDHFNEGKRDLGGKKSDNKKEKREKRKKGKQDDVLEMEDEEFVDPHKAKYADQSKEKDEDLESEQSLSDTSDADEVGDVEELLSVSYPVYFNYAFIHPSQAPKSLKSPGYSFSIKGMITKDKSKNSMGYVFTLHDCTVQVNYSEKDKPKPLSKPNKLNSKEFVIHLNAESTLKLVTLSPLFPCLNEKPKAKPKAKK